MKKLQGYKFIDLFAGIGGFRIAFESFGAECVFSSEIDKYACKTYEANYSHRPAGDITKISAQDIPTHNILCAGFPCQPFSISGKQKGFEDTRGTMFFEIARIVDFHRPEILFLENVANLKKHNDMKTINEMVLILNQLGYKVYYDTLNSSDFGVPQSRNRIYFVCFKEGVLKKDFEFPKSKGEVVYLKDFLLSDEETADFVINRDDMVLKDIESIVPQAKPIRIGTINKGGQGERIYSPLGHAITLSATGGGPGARTGAYYINGKVRRLSPTECKRVQGFPEDFIIPVSNNQAFKQFGNSVAIPVLKSIIQEIEKCI